MLPRLILLFATALFSITASSHLLKIDRDIGVLMHIDPGDVPVEREKATLFLEIKDRTGRFRPERCDCRLRVSTEGSEIFNVGISFRGAGSSAASFVFPAAGIYRVEVTGTPAGETDFQAFRVPFDIRVERDESAQDWRDSEALQYWAVGTVLLIASAGFLFVMSRKK